MRFPPRISNCRAQIEDFGFPQTSATRPQFKSQWKFATRAINTDPIKAAVRMYRAARTSELCVTELNMNSPSIRTMQTARDYTPALADGATGVLARRIVTRLQSTR